MKIPTPDIEAVRAERDRLRAALEEIASLPARYFPNAVEIAESALDRAEPEEQDGLECDCCGDAGAYPDADGLYGDGQELVCGCPGWVSIDDVDEPPVAWINDDSDEPCRKCWPDPEPGE
jgi:hypothetical protein